MDSAELARCGLPSDCAVRRRLSRVLNVVDWPTIAKGDAGAWLYFYEDFLEVYAKGLRKKTGPA
jgi:hypothetical protein